MSGSPTTPAARSARRSRSAGRTSSGSPRTLPGKASVVATTLTGRRVAADLDRADVGGCAVRDHRQRCIRRRQRSERRARVVRPLPADDSTQRFRIDDHRLDGRASDEDRVEALNDAGDRDRERTRQRTLRIDQPLDVASVRHEGLLSAVRGERRVEHLGERDCGERNRGRHRQEHEQRSRRGQPAQREVEHVRASFAPPERPAKHSREQPRDGCGKEEREQQHREAGMRPDRLVVHQSTAAADDDVGRHRDQEDRHLPGKGDAVQTVSALDRRAACRPGAGREREDGHARTDARRAEGAPDDRAFDGSGGRKRTHDQAGGQSAEHGAERDGQQRFQSSSSGEDDSPLALDDREPRFAVAATHVERTGDDGGRDGDQRSESCEQSDHRRQCIDTSPGELDGRLERARRDTAPALAGMATECGARRVRLREEPLRGGEGRGEALGARRRHVADVDRELVRVRQVTATDGARDLVELLAIDEQERR